MLELFLLMFIAALILPFIYVPLYARFKISRTASLYIEQASIGSFPPEAGQYIQSVSQVLVSNGFTLSTYLNARDENPKSDLYGALFINWQTGDLAIANYVTLHQLGRVFNITMAQFYSAFEDGSEIVTDNS